MDLLGMDMQHISAPQRRVSLLFVGLGCAAILLGGFVSAGASMSPSEHASWAAAYLVLVTGAAQIFLGVGQERLIRIHSERVLVGELLGWNLGNAAVLGGVLLGSAVAVDVASAVLFGTLVCFAWMTKGARHASRVPLFIYRVIILLLALSIPAGALLARVS